MTEARKVTDLVKFVFWGWLSFKAWDYMVASGSKLLAWKLWSNRTKLYFQAFVPGITSMYLNLTQMSQIHRGVGLQKGRSYVRALVILNLLSNVAVLRGV